MSFLRAGTTEAMVGSAGTVTLAHDERHLRRRALTLDNGERILVDLPAPVSLSSGDRLILEDGRSVEIVAAPEALLEVRGRDGLHLTQLAWHLGNRHLAAAIEPDRVLVLRDHVIEAMVGGLGATVTQVVEAFEPLRGAYAGHAPHGHGDHPPHVHVHAVDHPPDARALLAGQHPAGRSHE